MTNTKHETNPPKKVNPLKGGVTKPTGPSLIKDGRAAGEKRR
jgi:hypothetical protein